MKYKITCPRTETEERIMEIECDCYDINQGFVLFHNIPEDASLPPVLMGMVNSNIIEKMEEIEVNPRQD